MDAPARRDDTLLLVGLGASALALVGAIRMLTQPSSEVIGGAGRPEGWFALIGVALALFFLLVYRAYRRPRALKLAAVAGLVMLVAGLWATATLPPDCGELGEQGLPVACLDLYGREPDAAAAPSVWGIWLVTIGGLAVAGTSILGLYRLAKLPDGREPAPRKQRPRPPARSVGRAAAATTAAGAPRALNRPGRRVPRPTLDG